MPKAYLFVIVAKVLLQEASVNATFIIINLLIFVIRIIEIYGSLDCLTSCTIDRYGGSIIHVAQLVILHLYHKNQNKPNHLLLVAKILLQKLGINSIL